jgi:AmmeMemoRadiSam system protein B
MKFNETSLSFMGGIDPKKLLEDNPSSVSNPIAIISPHAGYIFSGDVAASAFNTIDPDKQYDTIFILSTSHTAGYRGASVFSDIKYETPFGDMIVNSKILYQDFIKNDIFNGDINHFKNDHTIEVVLPFIQHRVKYKTILPIMIGDSDTDNLKIMAEHLKKYLSPDNLFIISSDFSHYPPYDLAIKVDNETKDLILAHDSKGFINNILKDLGYNNLATRMCGWSSYLTFLYMTENEKFNIEVTKYKNSGDTGFAGKDRVVGYFGVTFNK